MVDTRLHDQRQAIVLEHTDSENRHAFADTVKTFGRPRYEVVATGETHVGAGPVLAFLEETFAAFPDMSIETKKLYPTADAVLVEVVFRGTHQGSWRGLPATGRTVEYAMCNVFEFEGASLTCERLYFDMSTILRQLGIARDPTTLAGRVATFVNHPITVGAAFARRLKLRPR